jgi:hypothetical protein
MEKIKNFVEVVDLVLKVVIAALLFIFFGFERGRAQSLLRRMYSPLHHGKNHSAQCAALIAALLHSDLTHQVDSPQGNP